MNQHNLIDVNNSYRIIIMLHYSEFLFRYNKIKFRFSFLRVLRNKWYISGNIKTIPFEFGDLRFCFAP